MKAKFVCWIFSCLITWNALAQNAREDIRKINESLNSEELSLELTYLVFADSKATAPIQKETGKVIKSGKMMYHKIGGIEVIRNSDYVLVADHEMKTLTLMKPEQQLGTPLNGIDTSAFSLCQKIEFAKGEKNSSYTLAFPGGEYTSMRVVFDNKTYQPKKFEFFYRNPLPGTDVYEAPKQDTPKLEIVYDKVSRHSQGGPNTFSYTNFLKKEKGKYYPLEMYKDYEFINQL